LTFDLGYLEYHQPSTAGETPWIIIGVVAGAGILIVSIIVIAILVYQWRKSRRKDWEYRRLLARLAALESSVRDQCKQGILAFPKIKERSQVK